MKMKEWKKESERMKEEEEIEAREMREQSGLDSFPRSLKLIYSTKNKITGINSPP